MVRCEDVKKYFRSRVGIVRAVDGVSLDIEKGDVFGLVGESGCGKTTLGKMILGIMRPDSGNITVESKNVQVIFQDPYNSLDPRMKVSDILAEGLIVQPLRGSASLRRAFSREIGRLVDDALDMVRLPKASLEKFPHQFSGGERQRIAIARAIITKPDFIVCDEPVSSLDVTIQLDILKILEDIRKKYGMTYLFISHDLKVVKFICSKVAVMRQGRILETGAVSDIYRSPSDPYTRTLLKSAFYDAITP